MSSRRTATSEARLHNNFLIRPGQRFKKIADLVAVRINEIAIVFRRLPRRGRHLWWNQSFTSIVSCSDDQCMHCFQSAR